jgi:hypothetical protein
MNRKEYRITRQKINNFILNEIYNENITENEIAKMLIEIGLSYISNSEEE